MSEPTTTHYTNKCEILGDLWMNYRNDQEFADFVEYNDLGLPLAYAIANNIVKSTEMAQRFIEETFDVLLGGLNIEDVGFENLNDVLAYGELDDKITE